MGVAICKLDTLNTSFPDVRDTGMPIERAHVKCLSAAKFESNATQSNLLVSQARPLPFSATAFSFFNAMDCKDRQKTELKLLPFNFFS